MCQVEDPPGGTLKILAIDIETAPALVYTFSLFKPFIGHNQVVESSRVICFSAQWTDDKTTQFYSEYHDGRPTMLRELHNLLDEADVLLTYNGKKFDEPWIRGELLVEGFDPPSPSLHIDLYQVIRSNARFLSNKLDYVVRRLLDDAKTTHTGFQLWVDCLAGDPEAWKLMRKYAKKDTALLIPLYEKLRPWIKQHPNASVGTENPGCPKCGSSHFQRRGQQRTGISTFQRYQCQSCRGWFRDGTRIGATPYRGL